MNAVNKTVASKSRRPISGKKGCRLQKLGQKVNLDLRQKKEQFPWILSQSNPGESKNQFLLEAVWYFQISFEL